MCHVVIAPDKFKGTLTAAQVAAHVAAGLERACPGLRTVQVPVADGGDGTVDAAEAAVLAAKNAPPRAPGGAAFLPDGQDLDSDLLAALEERVPAGASFGFNHLGGRTWIHVWGDGVDLGTSRAVLDAALTSLGRR